MKGCHGRKEVTKRVNKYERETKTLMQRIEKKKKERKKDKNDHIISLWEGEIDIFKMYSRTAMKKSKETDSK